MAINAGSVFVELGAKIDRSDFAAYDRELDKVRAKAAQRERFKAQLGADYDNRAFNSYYRDLEKSDRQTDHMVRTHGRLTTALKSTGGLLAATGGFAALGAAVVSATKAYGESEKSQVAMERQLKASGTTYAEHKKQIDDVITSVSNLAAVDDEDLQDAFTRLLRSTGDVNESLRLLKTTADLSAGGHIELSRAAVIVSKIWDGNTKALSRYGINLEKSTEFVDALKATTKHYTPEQLAQAKAADKQKNATEGLAAVQRKFAGQAEAYGKTQAGSTARLQNAFENLQEAAGKGLGPTLTRVSNSLARFFDQMRSGEGAGGGFVKVMKALGAVLVALGKAWVTTIRGIDDFIDRMLGAGTTVLGVIEKIADAGAKLPGRFGRPFRDAADKIHAVRKSLDQAREGFRLVAHPIDDVRGRLRKMADGGKNSLGDIRRATVSATTEIRKRLGGDTDRGAKALAANFRQAEDAVRKSMKAGVTTTRDGVAQINSLLAQELKLYGINPAHINAAPLGKGPGPIHTINRADGGWIGQRGMAGGDTVPAMLGVGEAVLNRHQQGVIEALLGDGFLDMLFARVNRPHFMAGGGIAGAVGAANQFEQAGFPYRWGGGHERSPTPFEPVDCSGAVSYVLQHAGVNIPTMVSGQLAAAGKPGAGALTVFANPVHTFMRIGARYFGTSGSNPGGGAGWFDDPGAGYRSRFAVRHFDAGDSLGGNINAPRIDGGGVLGRVVQGAMNTAARGANSALDKALATMGLGTGDLGDPGPTPRGSYGKADLARLWTGAGGARNVAQLMAAIALAESNGNPRAHNPSGATGLWQILGNPFPGDAYNPATNARMAVAKYQSQGLGAWEAYTNGSYRRYLNRGGLIHAARGLPGIGTRFSSLGRRKPPHRKPPVPLTIANLLKLKLAPGYGVDVFDGQYDIFQPGADFGRKVTGAANRLDVAAARAALTDDLQDDINIAKWQEHLWSQVYFGRVARHAPGSKIMAAAQKLGEARASVAGFFGDIASRGRSAEDLFGGGAGDTGGTGATIDPSENLQAILDQTNTRLAGVQGNLAAAQRVQQTFTSSGDIGRGGFANAFSAARMAPIVINTLHPGDPQTLAAVAQASNAGNSLAPFVTASRSTVGV